MRARVVTLDLDWPAEVPHLGPRRGGQPLGRCLACPETAHPAVASTFVRYGDDYVCRPCALALTREAGSEILEMLARARRPA